MKPSLQGHTAIVTGATSGLGWCSCMALGRLGARVVATGRRVERLRALQAELEADGIGCLTLAGDAGVPETSQAVIDQAIARFGRIDILINNAGEGLYRKFEETTLEDYDRLMQSNVRSGFLFSKAAVPHFVAQKSGVLVFVSSVAGLNGAATESVYSATKFAQAGMAQSLDEELRPMGVQVATVYAGGMKTEFALGHGRERQAVADSAMGDPADTAEAIAFLCRLPANMRVPQMVTRHMGRRT